MQSNSDSYEFGPFRLDVSQRQFWRGDQPIRLRIKVFDTLRVLVENAGKLLTKEQLMAAIWADTAVEENNLNHNISVLRKVLGESATGQNYIQTIPRVGYRFVAPVNAIAVTKTIPSPPRVQQEIRYCVTGDGVRLAYADIGSGPPLVKASNWLTHLDLDWESPIWRHWWSELGKHHRVIRYDERGNGMSQRDVRDISFDTWVRDLETVVDAARLEQFTLLGISRGGPIAVAYAVRHPERVSRLVLYGAFAAGRNHVAAQDEVQARRALVNLVRLNWGVTNPAFCRVFTCRFMPNATSEHEKWFDHLQRVSTSAENAARLMEIDDEIDVRELLPKVTVPTLVLHCDDDHAVPPESGRQFAAEIPNARYVSLHSSNHLLLAEEPAWRELLGQLGVFLGWEQDVAGEEGRWREVRAKLRA